MSKPDPKTPAKPPAPEKDAKAAPKPKSRKLLVAAIAIVLLGASGGGGAWWWLHRDGDAGAAQAKVPAVRPPVFMNLEPFTVNLLEEDGEHYLQTSIVFQVADEKAGETMKAYLPVIRSRLLLLLSSKRPSDIASPAGKAKLVEEVTGAVRESVPGTTPDRGIVQAFLGAFVIQ